MMKSSQVYLVTAHSYPSMNPVKAYLKRKDTSEKRLTVPPPTKATRICIRQGSASKAAFVRLNILIN